jgi:hypothetical protein
MTSDDGNQWRRRDGPGHRGDRPRPDPWVTDQAVVITLTYLIRIYQEIWLVLNYGA